MVGRHSGVKGAFQTSKPKSRHTPPPTKATPSNPAQTFHSLGGIRHLGAILTQTPVYVIYLSPSPIAGILSLYCYTCVVLLYCIFVCLFCFCISETGLSTYP